MKWMKEHLGTIVAIAVLVAAAAIVILILTKKAQDGKFFDEC